MDCITISTFRNLEQQAIRQFNEAKFRENNRQIYAETFRQENAEKVKAHATNINKELKLDFKVAQKFLDYFA